MNNLSRQFLLVAGAFTVRHSLQAQDAPEPILDLHQHSPYNNCPGELVVAHQDPHYIKATVMFAPTS